MGTAASPESQKEPGGTGRIGWKAVVRFAAFLLLTPVLLFLTAGRWDWWQGWALVGLGIFFAVVGRAIVMRKYPELIAERAQYTGGEGAKGWDRVIVPLAALYGPLASWVVAGLDERFTWLPPVPLALQLAALSLVVLGYALSTWAMVVNRFFSAVVRIQKDRGHTVVTAGPYRLVRHPGYAGGLVAQLAMPLLLGSLWALIPAGLTAGLVVVRTALEDRTLQEELPGYAEYAQRTRYRLLPGIW